MTVGPFFVPFCAEQGFVDLLLGSYPDPGGAVASGQLYKIRDIVRTVLTRGIAGEGTAFAALDTGGGVMPVKEHFLPLSYISKIAVIGKYR